MKVAQAQFISSHDDISKCPAPDKPEFAFIGRSNVGKSSLINMLLERKYLAKTSSTPGKTQTINHYLVNEAWYLVDLPGYGYAHTSKAKKKDWAKMIKDYILKRETLYCLFILLDSRLPPQTIDIEFINWAGSAEVPIGLILTKTDKLTKNQVNQNRKKIETKLLESWEELPPMFNSSAIDRTGRESIIEFMEKALNK